MSSKDQNLWRNQSNLCNLILFLFQWISDARDHVGICCTPAPAGWAKGSKWGLSSLLWRELDLHRSICSWICYTSLSLLHSSVKPFASLAREMRLPDNWAQKGQIWNREESIITSREASLEPWGIQKQLTQQPVCALQAALPPPLASPPYGFFFCPSVLRFLS